MTNATVTITRPGDAYNATTGYRESTSKTAVFTSAKAVFSQSKGSGRQVNANGLREYVKPVYGVLIEKCGIPPGEQSNEIKPGDEATVVSEGITKVYTVNDAVKVGGLASYHWELNLEAIKTQ